MGGRFLAWVARGRMLLRNMVLAWRRHDGLLKSVKSFSCAGEGGAAGLRPAPAVVPAAGRQQPKPKPKPKRLWLSAGLAGRCGLAGHAVNPQTGPAAGGCAFGRLRSSASQAKRPHPWGLDGAIHGANGPASPHRPTLDRFRVLLVGVDLGRHICQLSNEFIRVDQGRHLPERTLFRQIAKSCRRRGGSGCGGVSRMDAATELTWTYLQRPPQPDPPRLPTGNQLLLLVLLLLQLGAGAGRSPAEHPPLMLRRRMHSAEPACST